MCFPIKPNTTTPIPLKIHSFSSQIALKILSIPGECASLLAELKVEYEEANRGFQLREVAGGWRLFTHPAYHDVVEAYVMEQIEQ